MKTEMEMMEPQTKVCRQPPEAGETRNKFSPGASRGSAVLPTP